MSRPTTKTITTTGFGLAGGGSFSALAATDWPVVALAGLLFLTATTTLCWVLSDSARTRRATTLINALRRSPTP